MVVGLAINRATVLHVVMVPEVVVSASDKALALQVLRGPGGVPREVTMAEWRNLLRFTVPGFEDAHKRTLVIRQLIAQGCVCRRHGVYVATR